MASIESRRRRDGSLRHRVRISLPGHPRLSRTFSTKAKAKGWAVRTEAAMREARYAPIAEAERTRLGALVERFTEEKLALRAPRDRKRLTAQLDWWVRQLGAATPLSHITPARIVAARDRLARGDSLSGKVPSPATVRRYLALLSKLFSVAVKEWFLLQDNPCTRVPRPPEPRGRARFLSDAERDRLLAACRASDDPRLYPLVILALATGARRGELLSLRWGDVDLHRGMAILEHTKNGDRRSLALTGAALDLLNRWADGAHGSTEYVFANPQGKPTFPAKPWHRAVARAELADFRFHDLRHSAASYLAMSGATLAEIAEVLGHKTLAMVGRYAHLTQGHTRSVVERMNRQFLG